MDASVFSHPGFIGGLVGTLVGLAGGSIGFYCSWRNATSDKERKVMLLFTLFLLIATFAFVALHLLGDRNVKTLAWIAFGILYPPLMFFGIRHLNRLHRGKN